VKGGSTTTAGPWDGEQTIVVMKNATPEILKF
jgi:hypothetical protein